MKAIFEKYLDALEESIPEQLSFEDSMGGNTEDDYWSWYSKIEDIITEYGDILSLESFLISYDNAGAISIEDPIMDICSILEDKVSNYHITENLREIIGDKSGYLNHDSYRYIKSLTKSNKDVFQKELWSNKEDLVTSEETLNQQLLNVIIELNINEIAPQFNKNTLLINPIFLHFKKVISSEIYQSQKDLEKAKEQNVLYKRDNNPLYGDPLSFSTKANRAISTYKRYINLFKKSAQLDKGDHLNKRFVLQEHNSLEQIDDEMHETILISQIKTLARKYVGNYTHLINEESINLLNEVNNSKTEKYIVKNELKSLAAFKGPDDLNTALTKIIELKNGGVKRLIYDLEHGDYNTTNLYEDSRHLLISLDDYDSSRKFGSNRWCTSRSEQHYNSYKGTSGKNLILFNKLSKPSDQNYRIGITINDKGKITHAFDNQNKSVIAEVENRDLFPSRIKEKISEIHKDETSPKRRRSLR